MDVKRLLSPFKDHYDKIGAAVVLAVLFVTVVLLGIRAAVARSEQNRITAEVTTLAPRAKPVEPIDKRPFDEGLRGIAAPMTITHASWTNEIRLLVPETRIACPNRECGKPIDNRATKCPFCGVIVDPVVDVDRDSDGDGIPDVWELEYGLDKNNTRDAAEDTDRDGYTNLQEYQWKTNPTNSDSCPPAFVGDNLVVMVVTAKPFSLKFVGVSVTGATNSMFFQINDEKGGAYWVRLGEQVQGFTVLKYEAKYELSSQIKGTSNDVSELTLQIGERPVVLVKNQPRGEWEKSGRLLYKPESREITIEENMEFEIKGAKYQVKTIDVSRETVLLVSLSDGKEEWLGMNGKDE